MIRRRRRINGEIGVERHGGHRLIEPAADLENAAGVAVHRVEQDADFVVGVAKERNALCVALQIREGDGESGVGGGQGESGRLFRAGAQIGPRPRDDQPPSRPG